MHQWAYLVLILCLTKANGFYGVEGFRLSGSLRRFRAVTATAEAEADSWSKSGVEHSSTPLKTSEMVDSFWSLLGMNNGEGLTHLMAKTRGTGEAYLDKVPMISGKQEAWKYTNLKRLFEPFVKESQAKGVVVGATDVAAYIDEACAEACLVFVDGIYRADLSSTAHVPASIDFASLQSGKVSDTGMAMLEADMGLAYMVDVDVKPRDSFGSDVLTAMNMKGMVDAAVLHVPKDVDVQQPLEVLYYSSGAQGTFTAPRTVVNVEPGAQVHLKQVFAGGGSAVMRSGPASMSEPGATDASAVLVNSNTHCQVASGGSLMHTYVQEMGLEARHLETLTSEVSGEGSYECSVLQMGSRIGKVNAHIHLRGAFSNGTINGTLLAHARQSLDLHSSILHGAPDCQSRQQQRNVIGDRGEAIFKGRIVVPKIAQGTDSDQLCRTLMLGERARIVAMPTLEITADDVTCSHGASVADLDENSMFYLGARGIGRKEARKLLVKGFVYEMVGGAVMGRNSRSRIDAKLVSLTPENDLGTSAQALESI